MRRDDKWLFQKLDEVWKKYFPEVYQDNDVHIIWGRKAIRRLGSIRQGKVLLGEHPETIITINSHFKNLKVPEFVIELTIAHELAHYAHGFHSPIEQKFNKPHQGGIIHKEFKSRGLDKLERIQKKWMKENWADFLADNHPQRNFKPKTRKVLFKWK